MGDLRFEELNCQEPAAVPGRSPNNSAGQGSEQVKARVEREAEGMRSSRRRFSDGNLGPVVAKARVSGSEGVSASELEEILEKKELTPHETMVIRQSMVQV